MTGSVSFDAISMASCLKRDLMASRAGAKIRSFSVTTATCFCTVGVLTSGMSEPIHQPVSLISQRE